MLNTELQKETQKQDEERYRRMIEEIEDYAIILLNAEGIIQNWNMGAEKIKGYSADEVIGKSFRIFYTPQDQATGLPETLLEKAATEGRAAFEGWRKRKDGSVFWGNIVITALHDNAGHIIGFTKVTRDLTEKKIAEDKVREYAEQLEKKNKELEEFTYVASHDLKEPLRKIITFGDLLNVNCKSSGDSKAIDYIARMQDAANRMMSLIDDLLQLSQVGSNAQAFTLTDLNEIVDRVTQDLEPSIVEKNAKIIVDKLPSMFAKPLQMQQLFQNLIANALKFNDKDVPVIHITTASLPEGDYAGEYLRILVKDNGIGFDAEDAVRIFDAFHRLHGRSAYSGSGIGLAICKKIVELHNGTIEATGEKGVGATFTIDLPAQPPQ
ncbi:MAG TPA: ATP-binding protein [Chitinophagaceae bacterium]|nr:ATP-binding protein [Chitinophagaceae bacterium]